MKIDALIEFAVGYKEQVEEIKLEYGKEYYSSFYQLIDIALATLQAHKDGFVMVKNPMNERTPFDEILGELE